MKTDRTCPAFSPAMLEAEARGLGMRAGTPEAILESEAEGQRDLTAHADRTKEVWIDAGDIEPPLREGQARSVQIFGAPMPGRVALVRKADADRLAEAVKCFVSQTQISWFGEDEEAEARAALAAYRGDSG